MYVYVTQNQIVSREPFGLVWLLLLIWAHLAALWLVP